MREIKFRLFHIRMLAMAEPYEDYEFIDESGERLDSNCSLDDAIYDNNTEVMQYTGLKDKNGVEIYEGDIIGRLRGNEAVVFHQGSFCIDWRGGNPTVLSHALSDYGGEVIGNIYQNPELLEK